MVPAHQRFGGDHAAAFFASHGLTDPDALAQVRARRNYYPSLVQIICFHLLAHLRSPASGRSAGSAGRPLAEIVRQPVFIIAAAAGAVAYGVMNLLMAATPLAMQICGLPFSDAAFVLDPDGSISVDTAEVNVANRPAVPGVVGVMRIVSNAYPDPTQFDPKADHYDPKSKREEPRWLQVDVKFEKKLKNPVTLATLRAHEKALAGLLILQPGSRLSVTPVREDHWNYILKLAK